MTDLVVHSLEAWDGVWRRNQHLVAGLLRSDPTLRVLFVEPSRDPLHDLRSRRPAGRGAGLRRVDDLDGVAPGRLRLFEPTKWLPRRVDHRVDRRVARSIQAVASRIGMTAPVLWVNDPSGAELARRTGWRSLYDITDDWTAADRPQVELDRTRADEAYLFSHCAEIVVCSPHLQRVKAGERLPRLIPNAVDVAAYAREHPRPRDLPTGPIALYVGTVHPDRVDVPLTARTAAELGAAGTVVLVGPIPLPVTSRRRLDDAGVLALGPRPSSEIPAYLTNADLLLVPHVVTPFTESLDPIKAYEYRAARRPVLSTAVPGFRDSVDEMVRVVDGADFPGAARRLLAAPPQHRCGGSDPDVPSWSDRTGEMAAVIRAVRDSHG
jgi:teichuronic acid biosynthesis glycosyltransferase TuaH